VKIPECGVLDSIKPTSDVESKERQDMIDLALQKYFEVDRYLSSKDIFGIDIRWNCNSTICIPCNHKTQKKSDNFICFKVCLPLPSYIFNFHETVSGSLLDNNLYLQVIAMEPSDEPVLRVNKTLTALVLVGSSPSALPPDLLIAGPEGTVPLQRDTVKILASILAPTLCPTALSSKFRVSVLLYGLAGAFYIFRPCFRSQLESVFFPIPHNVSPLYILSCCCCCLFKIFVCGLKLTN
jgi:peroxin-6